MSYREPKKPIGTVIELFAGVGGFRIGLASSGWKTVFSNQWEPATKRQHASECYTFQFGAEGHSNEDIEKVLDQHLDNENAFAIPPADLVVGGFPCQDYSVAKSLNSAKGLAGKKGVLWWQIHRLLEANRPPMLLLENVDRLLKSPATQRGRDFAVMLASLTDLGYLVEWRVVNAAEYGFPQRRKRVFIVGLHKSQFSYLDSVNPKDYLQTIGVIARSLPVEKQATPEINEVPLTGDLAEISESFTPKNGKSPWRNSGLARGRTVFTFDTIAQVEQNQGLGSVLEPLDQVPDEYLISKSHLPAWKALKGAKQIQRVHAGTGIEYTYAEGQMAFPDLLENPSRTILTGEGGSTPSRFKHIILQNGKYRRLLPIELERLNGFPDDWTKFSAEGVEISDARRAFFMGNALVVGVVSRIGEVLAKDWKRIQNQK